jgi:hypothetical protein
VLAPAGRAPWPAPALRPVPVLRPLPPAVRPLPTGARADARVPSTAALAHPVQVPAPWASAGTGTANQPADASNGGEVARQGGAPGAAVAHHPSLGVAPEGLAHGVAGRSHAAAHVTAHRLRAGGDLGRVLACVGLLLTAALAGGRSDGRAATARGRARLAALLRPLAHRL